MRHLLPLFALTSLLACEAHVAPLPPVRITDSDEDALLVAEVRDFHRHHHPGGLTQFISMSLDTLGTADSRREPVERLQRDLMECMAPTRAIESTLLKSVADEVAAGAVMRGAVDEQLTRLAQAALTMRDCKPDALERLHGFLSTAEREALADKVQAQWEVWGQVNDTMTGPGHEADERLTELAQELNLTASQTSMISNALQSSLGSSGFDRKRADAEMQAFAAAFASETFDARTSAARVDEQLVTHAATRMVRFYETVAPLLSQDQRVTLAAHLRDHANHRAPLLSFTSTAGAAR
jgi:hypothetical protein